MTMDQYNELTDYIMHKVRGIVDDHPFTHNLCEVARRNMAYAAGHAALSSLTADDLTKAGAPHCAKSDAEMIARALNLNCGGLPKSK